LLQLKINNDNVAVRKKVRLFIQFNGNELQKRRFDYLNGNTI